MHQIYMGSAVCVCFGVKIVHNEDGYCTSLDMFKSGAASLTDSSIESRHI